MPPAVSRKLGHYVYIYVNPLDSSVFYVGKGMGGRALARLRSGGGSRKARLIKQIRARGEKPRIDILAHGLPDEKTASRVESAVIDALGVERLTNEVRGWKSGHFGRMALDELVSHYRRQRAHITPSCILVRINQLYRYSMSDVELYDATRGVWMVGKKRERARYALTVFGGIVREVYKMEQWFRAGSTYSTRNPRGVRSSRRRGCT